MADLGEQPTSERAPPAAGYPRDKPESIPPGTFDGEDFLFHLYRGSELLQDNCVDEAKEELEHALAMQPRDVEGQGLLGVVYFRLGLYPRAIQIYEDLIGAYPDEVTPRINLALCYLKTGQSLRARGALEAVIQLVPDHRRAWGYLGLVFERLGDHHKALASFERAGQPHMARRMQRILDAATTPPASDPPERADVRRADVRRAAADAVLELDAPHPFSMAVADSDASPSRSGRWRAVEPGQEPASPSRPPASIRSGPTAEASGLSHLPSATELAQQSLLVFSQSPGVVVHADGVVLVHVEESFVARIAQVRAFLPHGKSFASSEIKRRARGRDQPEPLGGLALPLVLLEGNGELVIGAPEGLRAIAVTLDGELLYVREDRLLGFERTVRHENGRLATGDDDPIPMVQLSERGSVVMATRRPVRALEVSAGRPLTLRAQDVLGWTGRLLPQPVPASQAPASTHGLVAFNGDGAVFVDPA